MTVTRRCSFGQSNLTVHSPDYEPSGHSARPNARSLRHEESGLKGLVLSVPGRDIPATSPGPEPGEERAPERECEPEQRPLPCSATSLGAEQD